jgi:hypothetical protein
MHLIDDVDPALRVIEDGALQVVACRLRQVR